MKTLSLNNKGITPFNLQETQEMHEEADETLASHISKAFALLHVLINALILSALVLMIAGNSHASKHSQQNSKLKKDISFHGHTVSGKYQLPLESTTTVEDEKSLDDLIRVRKNFQDRNQKTQELR